MTVRVCQLQSLVDGEINVAQAAAFMVLLHSKVRPSGVHNSLVKAYIADAADTRIHMRHGLSLVLGNVWWDHINQVDMCIAQHLSFRVQS